MHIKYELMQTYIYVNTQNTIKKKYLICFLCFFCLCIKKNINSFASEIILIASENNKIVN